MPVIGHKVLCSCKPDGELEGEPYVSLDHYARKCTTRLSHGSTVVLPDIAERLYQHRLKRALAPRYDSKGLPWYSNTMLNDCPATMYLSGKYDFVSHPLDEWYLMMGEIKHLFLLGLKESNEFLIEQEYSWKLNIDGEEVMFFSRLDEYHIPTKSLIDYKSKGDKEIFFFWPEILGGKKKISMEDFLAETKHQAYLSQLNVGAEFMRQAIDGKLIDVPYPEHLIIRRLTHSDAGPLWTSPSGTMTGLHFPLLPRETVVDYVKHNVRMLHRILKPGADVDETALPLHPPFTASSYYPRQPKQILARLKKVKGFSELTKK